MNILKLCNLSGEASYPFTPKSDYLFVNLNLEPELNESNSFHTMKFINSYLDAAAGMLGSRYNLEKLLEGITYLAVNWRVIKSRVNTHWNVDSLIFMNAHMSEKFVGTYSTVSCRNVHCAARQTELFIICTYSKSLTIRSTFTNQKVITTTRCLTDRNCN